MVSASVTTSRQPGRSYPGPLRTRQAARFIRPDVQRDTPDAETANWRAVCEKTARTVVCPGKASMFSRGQSCRGRSQSPVVRIAEEMETEPTKPIDKISLGEINESPCRNKSERVVASKVRKSEGRARNRRAKAA